MKTITLTAENEQDYELVLKLAQRLGLEYHEETLVSPTTEPSVAVSLPDVSQLTRAELLAIIDKGGDGKSIPDPLAWQREQRDDSHLQFHLLGRNGAASLSDE